MIDVNLLYFVRFRKGGNMCKLQDFLLKLHKNRYLSVVHKFGLFGHKKMTSKEIGLELGITRKSAQRHVLKTLKELRVNKEVLLRSITNLTSNQELIKAVNSIPYVKSSVKKRLNDLQQFEEMMRQGKSTLEIKREMEIGTELFYKLSNLTNTQPSKGLTKEEFEKNGRKPKYFN